MREVKIKREELYKILAKNQGEHREVFLAAQTKYREEVIKQLDRMLTDAREGRRICTVVELVEPEDHTEDYTRVLKMLELSTDNIVTLSAEEFQNYVMDVWSWSHQWAVSNSNYTSSAKLAQFTK